MRHDSEAYVVKEVHDGCCVAEVGRLPIAQQEQFVEHVEDLRRWLMDSHHDSLAFFFGVPLEGAHEGVGRMRIQTRRRLLDREFNFL